jgi:hypothetical protein
MAKKDTFSGPLLTIRLSEGLAAQNRLPLDNVIRVLQEVKGMVDEIGHQLAKEAGYEGPPFNLELIGGFAKGSVVANLAITRNPSIGVQAVKEVMETMRAVRANAPSLTPTPQIEALHRRRSSGITPDARVVRRLNNIAKVQEITRTKLDMKLRTTEKKQFKAVFDDVAAQGAAAYKKAALVVDDTILYGRLVALRDESESDELDPSQRVLGQLLSDDSEEWTISFPARDAEAVALLWTKQVVVHGEAHYFAARGPRLEAKLIEAEQDRDYVAAFDESAASMPHLGEGSIEEILGRAEG